MFPPSVRALVRGDHSAANLDVHVLAERDRRRALPTDWPGPGEDYPLKYLVQDSGIVGGDKLADAIADPKTASLNTDYFNAGYIGFIDSSQASYYGLPTARIENAAGQFVAATPQSIAAALSHAKTNADGVTVSPNFADTDPDDYPMPIVTYVTAPTSKVYEGRGITLRKFLTYAVGDAQTTLPDGYFPLSGAMVQQTHDATSKIPTSDGAGPGERRRQPVPDRQSARPGGTVPRGTTPVYPTGGAGPASATLRPRRHGSRATTAAPTARRAPTVHPRSPPICPWACSRSTPASLVPAGGLAALSALGLLGGSRRWGCPAASARVSRALRFGHEHRRPAD